MAASVKRTRATLELEEDGSLDPASSSQASAKRQRLDNPAASLGVAFDDAVSFEESFTSREKLQHDAQHLWPRSPAPGVDASAQSFGL